MYVLKYRKSAWSETGNIRSIGWWNYKNIWQ